MHWDRSERESRRNHMRENEGSMSVMQEGRSLQALQLDAYHKGSEMKQAHIQARCVLQGGGYWPCQGITPTCCSSRSSNLGR
jgi:hypothetical protein